MVFREQATHKLSNSDRTTQTATRRLLMMLVGRELEDARNSKRIRVLHSPFIGQSVVSATAHSHKKVRGLTHSMQYSALELSKSGLPTISIFYQSCCRQSNLVRTDAALSWTAFIIQLSRYSATKRVLGTIIRVILNEQYMYLLIYRTSSLP